MSATKAYDKTRAGLLFDLYEQASVDRRHAEEQCAHFAYCMLLLALGAVGLVKLSDTPLVVSFLMSGFLLLLGLCGWILTGLNCERRRCQEDNAKKFFRLLEAEVGLESCEVGLSPKQQSWLTSVWQGVHVVIMLLAIFLAVSCLSLYLG